MPAINKIRLTNVVYEEGNKRYNDELFLFDGYNGAILLENGGGKTVFIQTVLQAVIPHTDLADRKIKNTLVLENAPAHIAVEWILNDRPRRYLVTAVTLFMTKDGLDSLRYVYEYAPGDENGIEGIPFVKRGKDGMRPAERGEIQDYYTYMKERYPLYAKTFSTIKEYRKLIEEQYHIIADEWESIVKINSSEGGVEAFFEACKNTTQLFDRLLIPTVEQSIAGHDPKFFADMFESQHDSLKQYKKLKETIEENKLIQEELEKYVQTFENLHIARINYEKSKQKAKGIWEEIQFQKTEANSEKKALEQQFSDWEQKQYLYKVKKASFQIGLEKQTFENLIQEYEKENAEYISKEEDLDNYSTEFNSLKFAKFKQELRHFENEVTFVEGEMAKLKEIEELEDLEDQLEEAKQALLGYFLEQMDEINKEIVNIQYELNPISEQIVQLKQEIARNSISQQTKQKELVSVQNTINTRTGDMKKLEQSILSNPQQEQVEIIMGVWQKRQQFLDEEVIRLSSEKNKIQKELIELEESNEDLKEKKFGFENDLQSIQIIKEQIEKDQLELVKRLGRLRPQWTVLESVYESEQSILNRLIETIEKFKKEKEELLYKERVAYRLVDDYENQKTFFSDPIIEKRIKTWKNQLDYCVTGIEYLQMLNESDYQEKAAYPLWAVTLVTTNKSKEILQRKIAEIADHIRYPIQIMTTEEAAIIQAETVQQEFSWIIPSHWHKCMVGETFEQWKQKFRIQAEDATNARTVKEKELKDWENGLLAFQEFLDKYPFEKITELQAKQSELVLKVEQMKREIEDNVQRKEDILQQMTQIEQTMELYQEEFHGIVRKIEKGNEYLKYSREVKEAKEKEKQLTEEIKSKQLKLNRLQNQLDNYKEQKKFLLDRKRKHQVNLQYLENDENYKEIKMLPPIFTGESKKIIQDKIRSLDMKIHQINTSYGELNVRLKNAKENVSRITKDMDQLRDENENLDENREFPSDGEDLLQKISLKIRQLKSEISRLEEKVKEKQSAKDKQEGILENSINRFSRDFPEYEIYQFTDSFEKIASNLKQEKKNLHDEKNYLDGQIKRVNEEMKLTEDAGRLLERYIEKHHFNAPQVEPIHLSSDEKMDFKYNRKKFANAIVQELEERNNRVDSETKRVDRQKQEFKRFCLTISDIKLRKMAENGIEYKTNFEDLLDFKKNMMISVQRATNYANEHIRKKDEELQAYINQIHAHLKTVVEELKQIPKYTKVKVDDNWKTIYIFTISEWEEEEGKKRIRDYIEWIMNQLESDRYVKEDGIQDEWKIRKDIEMWLQTKQLLQIVMKNESMKVSCRKVTNENMVTTRAYSWEQSNVWSGGEKWSKNMTLFLGLLNYVAEKKQHKQTNMKHNRAVIIDNPFGKASSDHVLSPVFFVAEQLGFQIIALTAHAEGKFLQDYFPIIYSCRLRESKDSNKQIMTKEKWLHSAYFQEHEPETLDRLTETEQMKLF